MTKREGESVVILTPAQRELAERSASDRAAFVVSLVLVLVGSGVLGVVRMIPTSVLPLVTPDDATSFWTMITGSGTLALACVAAWGLNSLRLTRRDMVTRAKRDARLTAIARCEEFADEIIPLNQPCLAGMARDKTPVFVKSGSDVRFSDIDPTELKRASEWYAAAPPEVHANAITLLNKVEAWSMYFTAQLADADIAYEPVGTIFCSLVIQYYAILLLLRADTSAGNYTNVVSLYEEWLAKLTDAERAQQQEILLDQIAALQRKGPANTRLGKPLGYEG